MIRELKDEVTKLRMLIKEEGLEGRVANYGEPKYHAGMSLIYTCNIQDTDVVKESKVCSVANSTCW